MSDDYIQAPPDSTGKRLDNESLVVGGRTVYRQRIINADPYDTAGFARVKNNRPASNDYGLVTRDANYSANGAVSLVASSASAVILLAANPLRLNAMFVNDSNQVLYLYFSAAGTVSAANWSIKLLPGDIWSFDSVKYQGIVTGIWVSANGQCRVTEFT